MPVKGSQRYPGFAVVEALVALVLLSVALAGSAVLLVQAVRHERSAGERGRALRHVASLADALRALQRTDGEPLQAVRDPGSGASCTTHPEDCIAEAEAGQQLEEWRTAVAADMPAGAAAGVQWLPAPGAAYSISVTWPTPGGDPGGAVQLLVDP